jgi:hypothetical protein
MHVFLNSFFAILHTSLTLLCTFAYKNVDYCYKQIPAHVLANLPSSWNAAPITSNSVSEEVEDSSEICNNPLGFTNNLTRD